MKNGIDTIEFGIGPKSLEQRAEDSEFFDRIDRIYSTDLIPPCREVISHQRSAISCSTALTVFDKTGSLTKGRTKGTAERNLEVVLYFFLPILA